MYDRIINEINICLENNATIAALALALTIPDVFSKIKYPGIGQKKRYVDWVNNFATGIINQKAKVALPVTGKNRRRRYKSVPTDGKILYHIRNTLLHNATTKISSNRAINSITLVDDKKNQFDIYSHSFGSTMMNGDENTLNIHYRLSIRALVDYLKTAAENYYSKNKEKLKEYDKDWTLKYPSLADL